LIRYLVSREGNFTCRILGSDFGLARHEGWTFIMLKGHFFLFPLDFVVFFVALTACGIALVLIGKHFALRKS
jgi:hypothetical protein